MRMLRGDGSLVGLLLLLPTALAGLLRRNELLNGDVLYALGGLRHALAGGVPFDEIFIARPYTYKLVMGPLHLSAPADSAAIDYATHRRILLLSLLALLLVTLLLFVALRRWSSTRSAAVVASAVSAALAFAPKWDVLEPDWVAAVVAVCAFAAALLPRAERLGWILSGTLLCLTATMKLSTAAFAATVVVLLWLVDRRRAVGAAAVGAAVSGVWFVLSRMVQPIEWMWFSDQAALVHDSPIHRMPRLSDLGELLFALTNKSVVSPVLVTSLALIALYVSGAATRTQRRERALVSALIVISALASGYAQGEWFLYHFANLPILVTGLWAALLVQASRRVRAVLLIGPAVVAVVAAAVMTQPPLAADAANTWVTIGVWVSALGMAVLAVRWRESGSAMSRRDQPVRPVLLWAAPTVACLLGLAGTLPASTLAYSGAVNATSTTRAPYDADALATLLRSRSAAVDRLTSRLGGPDVPVLYLTYGGRTALLPFPATCAYPSPQWLQRASRHPFVTDMDSYSDNFDCVSDPRPRWLIVQSDWMDLDHAPTALQSALRQHYDCTRSLPTIVEGLMVCPRR
ncbi:hypothetical protein IEE94_11895 [Yimella sp. cx-573]|nr:hypothetical protein [Yimella sp. cx-573]